MRRISEAIYVNVTIGKEEHQHECQIECLCPRCTSDNIKLNGHETTVKGNPQKCYCRDCGAYFFPHTSYHVNHLHQDLKESIGKCVEGGRFNASVLKAAVPASLSAI